MGIITFNDSHINWFTLVSNKLSPIAHSLQSKCTNTAISGYVTANDIGVIGGSGAVATVCRRDIVIDVGTIRGNWTPAESEAS